MTITTLDPKTALAGIDLQKGIVALPTAHPVNEVVKHAVELPDAYRSHALPVVLVNVAGGAPGRAEQPLNLAELLLDWADLVPELQQQPKDHIIAKRTWGAFTNTGLDETLKKQGVTHVLIAEVATSVGVESAARYAHELGVQHDTGHRCHDRHKCRCPNQQHHANVPKAGRDGYYLADHRYARQHAPVSSFSEEISVRRASR